MDFESNEKDLLKNFIDIVQSESNLSCSRNNYFLVITSILILSISQFEVKDIKLAICLVGIITSLVWLLSHHRSSEYIRYWKEESRKISHNLKIPNIYPKSLKGFEMRIILYLLPVAFIFFWIILSYSVFSTFYLMSCN